MDQDMVLKLELTLGETNVVINALATLPFNQVVNLIGKIKQQADPQVLPPVPAPTPDPTPMEAPHAG